MQDWQKAYADAISETDEETLKIKLDELEAALFLRLQELAKDGNGNHTSEHFAIQIATDGLRRLQIERLKFPPVPKETKPHHITE